MAEGNVWQSWLLFLYKVPHEPSSRRVYVWRKLKSFGAVLVHDSAWVLPMTPHSLEQFQWLAAEISTLGGDSLIWEAKLAVNAQDETLIRALLVQSESSKEEQKQNW
jgi:hypothetical protein